MAATLIRGALVPCDGWCAAKDVLIAGGRIAAVGDALEAPAGSRIVECEAQTRLLLPGLHNAHSHSSNFFQKGSMAPLPLELMAACRASLPPSHPWNAAGRDRARIVERYRLGALASGLHNLLSGATSVIDMLTLPEADGETGDDELAFECLRASMEGYRASGIRIYLGPHLMDSGDAHGFSGYAANFMALCPEERRAGAGAAMAEGGLSGLGEGGALRTARAPQDPERTRRALAIWRRAILELHNPADGANIILAPHNELTCSEDLYRGCAELMAEFPTVHATTHLLGTPDPARAAPPGPARDRR